MDSNLAAVLLMSTTRGQTNKVDIEWPMCGNHQIPPNQIPPNSNDLQPPPTLNPQPRPYAKAGDPMAPTERNPEAPEPPKERRSSQNVRKHGLRSNTAGTERLQAFNAAVAVYEARFQPASSHEALLLNQIAIAEVRQKHKLPNEPDRSNPAAAASIKAAPVPA